MMIFHRFFVSRSPAAVDSDRTASAAGSTSSNHQPALRCWGLGWGRSGKTIGKCRKTMETCGKTMEKCGKTMEQCGKTMKNQPETPRFGGKSVCKETSDGFPILSKDVRPDPKKEMDQRCQGVRHLPGHSAHNFGLPGYP